MSSSNEKAPPSILVARFKGLLKQREDEARLRGLGSGPTTEQVVEIYDLMLSELTCNVKPIITDLTIIAEQQREHAKGIAHAICARILEVCLSRSVAAQFNLQFSNSLIFFFDFLIFPLCKPHTHQFIIPIKAAILFQFQFRSILLFPFIFSLFHFLSRYDNNN